MSEVRHIQVTAVFGNEEEARKTAHGLVEARLAACAQVAGPIASVYWWRGAIEESREWVCIAKTILRLYPLVQDFIRKHHSYTTPEILAVPIVAGSPEYLAWIDAEVKGE